MCRQMIASYFQASLQTSWTASHQKFPWKYANLNLLTCTYPPVLISSMPSGSLEQDQLLVSVQGRLHLCQLCAYKTNDKTYMMEHLRTHTGERPFKCHLCPNTFARRCNLKRHVRSHTGERCYQCRLCPETFADSTTLKRHGLCHTGERPFCCVHCSASFSRRGNLNIHMSCHAGKEP
ncbi:uncharacterized protein LOC142557028 [Dermacentor variabilis]|uniref:uncharacterized protein LOC142557028 n=1 Tax=Dermacentor variabilis TaxID=34621 RepID=UPI003F5C2E4F